MIQLFIDLQKTMRTRSQRKASIKATVAIAASEPTVEKSNSIEEPKLPVNQLEEHPSLEVEYEPENSDSFQEDPEVDHEVKDLLQDQTKQESSDASSQTKSYSGKTPNKKTKAPKLSHTNNPLTLTPATSNETESVQSHRIQGINNNNNYNRQSEITINDSSNSFVKPREPDYDMVLEQVLKSSKNNIKTSKSKPPPGKIQPIIRHRKSSNDHSKYHKYAKRPKINTSNVVISSEASNTNNQTYNKHMKNSKIYKKIMTTC